jgi:hypothetical protein
LSATRRWAAISAPVKMFQSWMRSVFMSRG